MLGSIKEGIQTQHENLYQHRDDNIAILKILLVEVGHLDIETAEKCINDTINME